MSPLLEASRCGGPRLPFPALEETLGARLGVITGETGQVTGCSVRRMAEALGTSPRQVCRWRRQGLTWAQGDLLAVRLGLHPSTVWGRLWWQLDDEEALKAAAG